MTLTAQTVLSPTGHSLVTDPAVPAGCTTPGKTEGSHCAVCKAVLVAQQETSPAGHVPNNEMLNTCQVCGQLLEHPSITIKMPTLPTVQYDRFRVTKCTSPEDYNFDGTYEVILQFTYTNITSTTYVAGVWATLSGIEPSDGTSMELAPGESGTCTVYFFSVPAGSYEIMIG